jgi:hypothetical protein
MDWLPVSRIATLVVSGGPLLIAEAMVRTARVEVRVACGAAAFSVTAALRASGSGVE